MIKMSTSPNQKIRAKLLEKGITLTDWARNKGYSQRTVYQTLWRFADTDKRPSSGISLAIIEKLESETGIKICG